MSNLLKVRTFFQNLSYPYEVFGIFGIVTYPLYYFLWLTLPAHGYDSFSMRMIATFLCLPLCLEKFWPHGARRYIKIYWYIIITYCLPFFFTYLLFVNQFSFSAVLNMFTVIVLSILLLRPISLLIILSIGAFLGWGFYALTMPMHFNESVDYPTIIFAYGTAILFGVIFAHRKTKTIEDELSLLRDFSGNLAHELRTPLTAIRLKAEGMKPLMHRLISGYRRAKLTELIPDSLREAQLRNLDDVADSIQLEASNSLVFIDNLLVSLTSIEKTKDLTVCSAKFCVEDAINRYPFQKNEISLVKNDVTDDFAFLAEPELMYHVLLNLLKNALYYVAASGKHDAAIYIYTQEHSGCNQLIVKDTGTGILNDKVNTIFQRFYSDSMHGYGIGLAFCQDAIQSFNGQITCDSVEGEYTRFIMSFPKLGDNDAE